MYRKPTISMTSGKITMSVWTQKDVCKKYVVRFPADGKPYYMADGQKMPLSVEECIQIRMLKGVFDKSRYYDKDKLNDLAKPYNIIIQKRRRKNDD